MFWSAWTKVSLFSEPIISSMTPTSLISEGNSIASSSFAFLGCAATPALNPKSLFPRPMPRVSFSGGSSFFTSPFGLTGPLARFFRLATMVSMSSWSITSCRKLTSSISIAGSSVLTAVFLNPGCPGKEGSRFPRDIRGLGLLPNLPSALLPFSLLVGERPRTPLSPPLHQSSAVEWCFR